LIGWSWLLVPTYALLGGAFSTYWDWLFKGEDNFWFSGFMVGLALFPLIFCGFIWWVILIRAIVLSIAWGVICSLSDNDFTEEYVRGASAVIF
jgi:hypothetical protein